MPNDLISWNCLNQLNGVIGLEISNLIFDFSNNPEVCHIEYELRVNVDLIRDFSQSVFDKKNVTSLKCAFQIDSSIVLDEESDLRFVISRFQVDVTRHLLISASVFLIRISILD